MISSRETGHDFLVFTCGETGFLVNRNQFSSSLYIESPAKMQTAWNGGPGRIDFGGRELMLFDFIQYLQSLFRFGGTSSADLALVVPTTIFSPEISRKICVMMGNGNSSCSADYVALRIASQSAIEHVDFASLRPLPSTVRNAGTRGGILGMRFVGNGVVQYFVDLSVVMTAMVEALR